METAAIIGALVGAVCGLVPLIYGLLRGQTGLAKGGFAACIVSGILLGVALAVPVAALVTWLVWRASRDRVAAGAPADRLDATPEHAGMPLDERSGERVLLERDRDRV